ncbi:MAG: hypothetical protein ACJAVI_000369 [Candidatus Azotimanducaceae bacterium]|jgi:hypothetical protein
MPLNLGACLETLQYVVKQEIHIKMPVKTRLNVIGTNQMRALLTLFLSVATLMGCSSLATEPPPNYSLTGDWQLNNALSDSPNLAAIGKGSGQRKRSTRGQGGGHGGGEKGRGQGRGQRGGSNGGGPPSGIAGRSNQAPVSIQVLIANEMSIEQNDESMGIEYNGSNYRDVSWGERKRGQLNIETGWKENNLVIKTEGGPLPIEETYILSEDGSRLTVIIELEGGKDDKTFTRVFDKVTAKAVG